MMLKFFGLCFVVLFFSGSAYADNQKLHGQYYKNSQWTINDLIEDKVRPFTIGHRGYGENLGEISDKPIENTVKSVRRAFNEGVSIVEVDVSVTADGKAVVIHDDFLGDLTCVNALTYEALKNRLPYVPTLKQVLHTAKTYARKSRTRDHISGLVNIEVKTPSPLCDPDDTTESQLVAAVIDAVKKTRTEQQVIVEGFSPAIISMFSVEAPKIKRNFSINALQLLSVEEIINVTGLPVTLIDKQAGFGLQWAEIGAFFRLPGYLSLEQFINVAFGMGAHFITFDKLILAQMEMLQPGSGAFLIQQLHAMNFNVTAYTVDTPLEWEMLAGMGIDGIYTNDIPMGVAYEQVTQLNSKVKKPHNQHTH